MKNILDNISMEVTWSIVVTAKALPENINIFLDHHLGLGVDNIYLFLDSPDDFNPENFLKKNDRVKIFKCDKEFWEQRKHFECLRYSRGERPDLVEYRQYHNMLHAHSICDSEWLLMMDIDELLYSKLKVSKILNKYPNNIFSVLIKPLEVVYCDKIPKNFKEVFSTKYFKEYKLKNIEEWDKIYYKPEIKHKSGFFGHITGKTFFRTGFPIKAPSCHLSKPYENDLGLAFIDENMYVMHFESQTFEQFSQKIKNRANKTFNVGFLDKASIERTKNIIENYNNYGDQYLNEIYYYMNVFSKEKIDQLIEKKLVLKIDISNSSYPLICNCIHTHHSQILAFDFEKEIVLGVNEKDFDELKHSKISISFSIIKKNFPQNAFLYFNKDGQVKYLYVNRDGYLIDINKKKSQLLDIKYKDHRFSLSLNNKFLSARKNGSLNFISEWQKDWELFSLSNFEC
ncbi:glycosyltransferase family 2 protein [Acinetobacter sp. ANC 5380]|uniref:Glycosyltransferase family 2 protein n=1 Tax=Acinetobacter terrae TaxID=2731247 RepID=A0A7Y2RDV9_9GAMM|nr:glycosyltransferase family 2 protein [Acinetobacter terrae]NNH76601.1 glycosyltransferase family 2 protein [Acinetobacter terrae]